MMPPRLRSTVPSRPVPSSNRQCLSRLSPRHLSTPTAQPSIPPESPKYISVPQSLQPDAFHHPYIKGILPIPRPIFPSSSLPNASLKASPTYLSAVTPEPNPSKPPPNDPLTTWKTQQAASRRRNLREGLLELHTRKQSHDAARTARSSKRQREHERLVAMPMREDERLTAPSILSSQLPSTRRLLDPNRAARIAAARANMAAHEAARKEQRREDLHELYVNAGTFITNEAQLDAVVDRVFEDKKQFQNDASAGENIWHLGEPQTVAQRMQQAEAGGRNPEAVGRARVVKERMTRIAEVLTGGKM